MSYCTACDAQGILHIKGSDRTIRCPDCNGSGWRREGQVENNKHIKELRRPAFLTWAHGGTQGKHGFNRVAQNAGRPRYPLAGWGASPFSFRRKLEQAANA